MLSLSMESASRDYFRVTDVALLTRGKISLMSAVEMTKPGGIAAGVAAGVFVDASTAAGVADEAFSTGAVTILP